MSSFFTSGFARKRTPARGKDDSSSAQHSSGGKGLNRNASSSSAKLSENSATHHAEKVTRDTESSWYSLQDREGRPYWCNSATGDIVYHNPVAPSCNHHLTTSPMLMAQPFPTPGYPLHIAASGPYPAAYQTPVAPSWSYHPTTSPMLMAQSFPTPGCPSHIAASGPYPAVYHTPVAPSFNHHPTTSPMLMAQPFPTSDYYSHKAAPGPYPAAHQPSGISQSRTPVIMPLVPNLVEPHKAYLMRDTMNSKTGKHVGKSKDVVVDGVEKPDVHKKTSEAVYYVWEKFYDEDGRVVWINKNTGKRTLADPYK